MGGKKQLASRSVALEGRHLRQSISYQLVALCVLPAKVRGCLFADRLVGVLLEQLPKSRADFAGENQFVVDGEQQAERLLFIVQDVLQHPVFAIRRVTFPVGQQRGGGRVAFVEFIQRQVEKRGG